MALKDSQNFFFLFLFIYFFNVHRFLFSPSFFLLQATGILENFSNHKFSRVHLQCHVFTRPDPDPIKSQHTAQKESAHQFDANFSDWAATMRVNTIVVSQRPRPAPYDFPLVLPQLPNRNDYKSCSFPQNGSYEL